MSKKIVMESLSSKDNKQNGFLKSIRGCVECKDKMGNILFKKDNVITQAGKFFLLEKLLGFVDYTQMSSNILKVQRGKVSDGNTVPDWDLSNKLVNRQLCAFAIGKGGISTSSTIGEVKAPSYSDTALYEPLLFNISNNNFEVDSVNGFTYNQYIPVVQDNDIYGRTTGCLYKKSSYPEDSTYIDGKPNYNMLADLKFINGYVQAPIKESGSSYELSNLGSGMKFVINPDEDDVHIEFELTIHETDLDCYTSNNRKFNELGLYIANVSNFGINPVSGDIEKGNSIPGYEDVTKTYPSVNGANVFSKYVSNPELFSHITFNNMDLSSSQEVTFTYYIYIL